MTSTEFEDHWKKMIENYSLEKNEWLKTLYDNRHRWVPAYVKDTFWAGMSTAQRSESMNAFFDGYVNSKTTLKQFVEQYDNALKSKVEKENQADFASFNSRIPLITDFDIEKQFQEVYTTKMFKEFQEELRGLMYCNVSFVKEEGSISTYEVKDSVKVGDMRKDVIFNVYYNSIEVEVSCLCHLFEFKGILCRHAIAVLNKNKVKKVSARYILSRWRKDLKRKHNFVKCSYVSRENNEHVQRYDKLCNYFYEIAEAGAESEENCKCLMSYLSEINEKMQKNEFMCSRQSKEIHGETNASAKVLSPLAVRTNGRPSSKRKESVVDQVIRKKMVLQRKKKLKIDKNESKKSEREQDHRTCTSNLPHMIKEIGSQDCDMLDPSYQNSYAGINSNPRFLGNQAHGDPNHFWTGCYTGVDVNIPNFTGNQPQGNPSQFWGGSHDGMYLNSHNFLGNLSQGTSNDLLQKHWENKFG